MRKLPSLATAAVLAASLCGAESAMAGTFNYSGNFTQDSDVQFFTFTLSGPTSSLLISTTSYAGSGGFFPLISLWDSAGVNMGSPPGVTNGILNGTPGDLSWDYDLSYLTAGPHTFYLALFVNPNVPDGNGGDLPGGTPTSSIFHFNDLGVNEFTGDLFCSGPHPGSFYILGGIDCEQRTGAWALGITSNDATFASPWPVPSGAAPEPATLALALAGLAGFAPFARRRAA
jgi:hypothetical protein